MNTALNYQPEVLVDTADLSREDWLDYRRLGIGGSDAAAIMGLSPFSTIRDLYFDKIGVTPVIEEEEENWVAKEVGHRLEDLVAMIFAKKTGLEVFPVRKMFRHPLYPFMLADVDYFIRFPDGSIGILECKTCNYNAKDKWADDGIPENYVLQVRHYLAVMNMNKAYIACRTFASHDHLPLMLDDRIPEERETAMQIGALMLDLCEVLIICGSCISEGMRREIQTAFEKGKDVYWYDSKMKPGELMKVENWRSIDDEVQIYT